jgi:DNA-binding transcriptional LysR family regulator
MTAAGQQFAIRARDILDDVANARAELAEVAELASGRLSIGATQTPGPLDIALLLREFHTLHPGVELTVREELSISVAARLRADEIDLGFISEIPESNRQGLHMRQVAVEPLVLVLPTGHRLANRPTIGLAQLRDEAFILFPEGATIRTTFDQVMARAKIEPNVAFVTSDTDRMRELVGLGLGISLLPVSDSLRPGHLHETAMIRGHPLTYKLFMAWRANRRRSPAALAIDRLLEVTFGRPSEPISPPQGVRSR